MRTISSRIAKLLSRAASAAARALIPQESCVRASQCRLDTLESRRLFSFGITGTDGDDTFFISVEDDHIIHLNFNGQIEIVNRSNEEFIDVLGFGGNDTIWLQNTGRLKFSLIGFGGDDKYTVGNGDLQHDIRRRVNVQDNVTGDGTDTLIIDDSVSPESHYSIDDGLVSVLALGEAEVAMTMGPDDLVTLRGGLGNDSAVIGRLRPNMTVNMGPGDDVVNFGGSTHEVAAAFPTGCVLDSGGGDDLLVIDDSRPSSDRFSGLGDRPNINIKQVAATIGEPRWMILDTVGVSHSFKRMKIVTHERADGQPQTVLFSGRDCPASFVTVVGCDGPDLIQVGSFSDPVDSVLLYTAEIAVTPGPGSNKLEIYEADAAPGHAWTLDGDKLISSGILTIRNKFPIVGTAGTLDVLVRGTRQADTFQVKNGTETWGVTLDGGQGDDVFEQYPLRPFDLDDTFIGYVKFDGGAGVDTVTLIDSQDTNPNADGYFISSRAIRKGEQGQPLESIVEMSFIDRLILQCNDDPNSIRFDGAGLQYLQINGGGGIDSFANRNEATGLPTFINSLATLTRLHGGAEGNLLTLSDTSGGAGNYDLGPADFTFTRSSVNSRVEFSGMTSVEVLGSNQSNIVTVRAKPTDATLNVAGNGGADLFIVGGGMLDGSGLAGATIGGGDGSDHIVFDDRFDDHASFDGDTLTIEFNSVTKDGVTIAYGGFESQAVITSGVNSGPIAFPTTVKINAIAIPTEIVAPPGDRDTIVEVGHGQFGLGQIFAPITLASSASMELKVFDLLSTANKQFVIGADSVTQNNAPLGLNIQHTGLDAISILAGNTDDIMIVEAVAPGTNVFCDGGGGNDLMSVGNGTFSTIHGPVAFSGGAGTADMIMFSNLFDFESEQIHSTLTSSSFQAGDGPLHQFFNGIEQLSIAVFSAGGTNLDLKSTTAAVTILGGSGDDHVTLGNGRYAENIVGDVTFNGNGDTGGDSILIDDSAGTGNDAYTFDAGNIIRRGASHVLAANSVEHVTLQASAGHNQINVLAAPFELKLFGNAGNDSIFVNDSTGFVTVNTGSEVENPPGAALGDSISVGNAKVRIEQDDSIILLQVNTGGTLRLDNNAVLCKQFAAGTFPIPLLLKGVIDLGGGALVYRNDGLDLPFRQWLRSGYNDGAWNGTSTLGAIHSSLARTTPMLDGVSYCLGSQLGASTIGSFTVNTDDMVLGYALSGDANRDRSVNVADLGIMASNWQQSPRNFSQGDFNYDGIVDVADLGILASNWQGSTPAPGSPLSPGASRAPAMRPNRFVTDILSV